MRKVFFIGCLSMVSFIGFAQKKPAKIVKKVATKTKEAKLRF